MTNAREAGTLTDTFIQPSPMMMGIDSISPYDGTGNIEQFLDSIEQSAVLGNWTQPQKVAVTKLKLRGLAKQFADAEPELKQTNDWTLLKNSLQRQYKKKIIPGQALREFLECKQRIGEGCRSFLTRLKVAAARTISYTGDAAHDRFLRLKLEEDTVKQFVMGLLNPVRRRVLSAEPATLQEALTIAEREETIELIVNPPRRWQPVRELRNNFQGTSSGFQNPANNRQSPRQYRPPTREQTNSPTSHWKPRTRDNREQSSATRQFAPTNVKCFKCNILGHFARNCTARRKEEDRRCFGCNQQGHLVRNCPNKSRQRSSVNHKAASLQPRGAAAEEAAREW